MSNKETEGSGILWPRFEDCEVFLSFPSSNLLRYTIRCRTIKTLQTGGHSGPSSLSLDLGASDGMSQNTQTIYDSWVDNFFKSWTFKKAIDRMKAYALKTREWLAFICLTMALWKEHRVPSHGEQRTALLSLSFSILFKKLKSNDSYLKVPFSFFQGKHF